MIFIHTHTGHCYGNIPASICPPSCLLCFYSSHPRIVFFCPSLPRVCDSQTCSGNHNSVFLLSAFPFTSVSRPEEQRSAACTRAQCTARGEFQTDHHWFAELPWQWRMSVRVTCCTIMYLEESFAHLRAEASSLFSGSFDLGASGLLGSIQGQESSGLT